MNQDSYIFSQLLGYVPKEVFDRIVKKFGNNCSNPYLPATLLYAASNTRWLMKFWKLGLSR